MLLLLLLLLLLLYTMFTVRIIVFSALFVWSGANGVWRSVCRCIYAYTRLRKLLQDISCAEHRARLDDRHINNQIVRPIGLQKSNVTNRCDFSKCALSLAHCSSDRKLIAGNHAKTFRWPYTLQSHSTTRSDVSAAAYFAERQFSSIFCWFRQWH